MRHADALYRNINLVGADTSLSRDIIRCEQENDELGVEYKGYENFWTDQDGI
jgi:hypothetical protein